MTAVQHDMRGVQTEDGTVFECGYCPRRVRVGRGGLEVLERGDFYALHSGGNLDLTVRAIQ